MTGLSRLLKIAEGRRNRGPTFRLTVPVHSDSVDMLKELADELELTTAAVARQALEFGVESMYAEFEAAKKEAAAREKAEKNQQKLKFGGGAK